jgi:ferredoxin-type protein NapG
MSFWEDLRIRLSQNPFKGFFKLNRLRPPGAVAEEEFMERCIRCARCIEICPYNCIKRADLYEKLQIGTPYIFAEQRACYLCMKCPAVCPTGALDPTLKDPKQVAIGKAVIDQQICLNYIYVKEEETGKVSGTATICSTCYNVCPYTDEAIVMEKFLLPVITEKCVGCGICVEKCPTHPKRAVNIVPTGMANEKSAGFYYQRSKVIHSRSVENGDPLAGEELIKKKGAISTFGKKPEFESDFDTQHEIEGWE